MACRLISDLGLHDENFHSRSFNGSVQLFHTFRRALLTACVAYDELWSLYLGRPSCIPQSSHIRRLSNGDSTNAMLDAWLGLCGPMSEVGAFLNTSPNADQSTVNRLSELDSQLVSWYAALPPELAVDENDVANLDPRAFGLHMQYCRVRMLLHRGSIIGSSRKRKYDGNQSQTLVLNGWTHEKSQQLVYRNALRIARLGVTYRNIYGIENTPSVMLDNLYMAARTLITQLLWQPEEDSRASEADVEWLKLLDDILEALQVHFPITIRMRKTLSQLIEGTRFSSLFSKASEIPCDDVFDISAWNTSAGPWGSSTGLWDDFDSVEFEDLGNQ
jgi:hypothetical protein